MEPPPDGGLLAQRRQIRFRTLSPVLKDPGMPSGVSPEPTHNGPGPKVFQAGTDLCSMDSPGV